MSLATQPATNHHFPQGLFRLNTLHNLFSTHYDLTSRIPRQLNYSTPKSDIGVSSPLYYYHPHKTSMDLSAGGIHRTKMLTPCYHNYTSTPSPQFPFQTYNNLSTTLRARLENEWSQSQHSTPQRTTSNELVNSVLCRNSVLSIKTPLPPSPINRYSVLST